MGRNKIAIERLPTEEERKAKYKKRRAGVVKKAHEIATLCDVDVVLIMFSCTGQLDHFSSQPAPAPAPAGIWKVLQRFVQIVQSISQIEPEDLPISQDVINSINNLARQHDVPDREEIKRENVDEIDCMLLQLQKMMMHPGRKAFKSEQEFRELVEGLHSVRLMIADGKEQSRNTSYNTSQGTQILMQQPQTRIEAGTRDPPGDGADMQQQQQQFSIFGEDPSSFLNVPWNVLLQYLQASPPGHVTCEGREHIHEQQEEVPMEDLFVSPEHLFGAQQGVDIFFAEQIESPEPGTGTGTARFEDTRNRNGKRDRSD